MAFVIFAQSLGPAIVLTICNVIFDSSLRTELNERIPHADAAAIMRAGATGYRQILEDAGDLAAVEAAVADSVGRVFYLVASIAAACGVVLWGMGWTDLRKEGNKGGERDGEGSTSNQ